MKWYHKLLFSLCLLIGAFILYRQLPSRDDPQLIVASSRSLALVCTECDAMNVPIHLWQSPAMKTVACRIPKGQDHSVRLLETGKHPTGTRMFKVHTSTCDGWIFAALVQ